MGLFVIEGADGGEDTLLREQEAKELKEELENTKEELIEVAETKGIEAKKDGYALPLSALKGRGKKKLPPFEQWVDDICHGRKKLDDEL